MDAILKLRILIWVAIIGLWGVMVYQYLGEEEPAARQMVQVPNPYKGIVAPIPAAMPESPSQTETAPVLPQDTPTLAQNTPALMTPAPVKPTPGFMMPIPPQIEPLPMIAPRPPVGVDQPAPVPDLPAPPGFSRVVTRHFTIHVEGSAPVSPEIISLLENLHGNLMLDLAAFSPWASDQKVTIQIFKQQETYRKATGRPVWSGGATSVRKRKIYIYESEELPGILAHELCHIYYDGFFLQGKPNPLWLSEGIATLVQVERGLAAPVWLRENLAILKDGGGFALPDLMRVSGTSGAQDAKVRLWYTQCYSLLRFMLRTRQRSAFYFFSQHLRDGKRVDEALYRAYGAPYTSLKALEHAWRYDLISGK
ncbi:MAG: hypothetical protein HY927_13595 [Elusimicrobia bacterium]|nr:hypothetical protein [Elusimicrobiota bacterium]